MWKIKLKTKYAKVNGEEILPETFETKEKAQEFFEGEGMDYDYYHIYKISQPAPTRKEIDRECLMAKVYPHHEPIQKEEEEMEAVDGYVPGKSFIPCKPGNAEWGDKEENTPLNGKTATEMMIKDMQEEEYYKIKPTLSDTFIESKMKEFDKQYGGVMVVKNEISNPQYGGIRQFLKSSLQSQRQSILEEIEKKKVSEISASEGNNELRGRISENLNSRFMNNHKIEWAMAELYNQALEDIKQLLKDNKE